MEKTTRGQAVRVWVDLAERVIQVHAVDAAGHTLRTVRGAYFLWPVLQHVLPKKFRRSRNFGFAHPNCKHRQRLTLLRMGLKPNASAACTLGMKPSTQSSMEPSANYFYKLP